MRDGDVFIDRETGSIGIASVNCFSMYVDDINDASCDLWLYLTTDDMDNTPKSAWWKNYEVEIIGNILDMKEGVLKLFNYKAEEKVLGES